MVVGDGITDLETKHLASLFIGFGGVQVREVVQREADCFVTSFSSLINALSAVRPTTSN